MERIVKRAAYASRKAARKAAEREAFLDKASNIYKKSYKNFQDRIRERTVATAQKRQKEAWKLGPLAPRYDVGADREIYGTLPGQLTLPSPVVSYKKPDWFPITAGDRVIVVQGTEKGKIGQVLRSNEDTCTLQIKGVNNHDVALPTWLVESSGQARIAPQPIDIPNDHARLIYPLRNQETGIFEDTIVEKLEPVGRKKVGKELDRGERVIWGTNTIIPWPEQEEDELQEHKCDTTVDHVDHVTFIPHLITAPMPVLLIDELRNKHSYFRTRFDDDFVARKEEQAAKLDKREGLMATMRTPMQELAARRLKEREASEKQLSDRELAMIGDVMIAEKAKAAKKAESLRGAF